MYDREGDMEEDKSEDLPILLTRIIALEVKRGEKIWEDECCLSTGNDQLYDYLHMHACDFKHPGK